MPTFTSWGYQKERRENKELKTYQKKIMTENFPKLVKKIDMEVQEMQRLPNKMNPKRPIPRHIIIKMPRNKDKERILK